MDVLVRATGRVPGPELTGAIQRMRRWLGCVLSPDGQVPLLNDGYPVDPALIGLLQPGTVPDDRLLVLPDTGLVRALAGGWRLLADVGAPCPGELPAHAHADTLSCLVHVGGVPLLVDTGTSTYAPGPVRDYERSRACCCLPCSPTALTQYSSAKRIASGTSIVALIGASYTFSLQARDLRRWNVVRLSQPVLSVCPVPISARDNLRARRESRDPAPYRLRLLAHPAHPRPLVPYLQLSRHRRRPRHHRTRRHPGCTRRKPWLPPLPTVA